MLWGEAAMRWTLWIAAIVLAAWAAFAVSPFVALYRLSRAVEARDVGAVRERINFRAVSLSLSRQLVDAYLASLGRGRELSQADRDLVAGAGVTLADPVVSQLVTPEIFLQLIDKGWPEGVIGAPPAGLPEGLHLTSPDEALRLIASAEARGFRRILVSYPLDEAAGRRFRLHLRLSAATWRVIAIDLPEHLKARLVAELDRRIRRSSSGALRSTLPGTL